MDKPNKGGTEGMHVDVVNVKHPCQGCVYYKACGNTDKNRTEAKQSDYKIMWSHYNRKEVSQYV